MATVLHLITGTDEARIKSRSKELLEQLTEGNTDPFASETISANENEPLEECLKSFSLSYMSPPFFGKKTVWLNHFPAFAKENAKSENPIPSELRNIIALFKQGLPSDINIIISGPDCDKRKSFFKTCQQLGEVEVFNVPEKKNRNWQQDMQKIVLEKAKEKQLNFHNNAVEYLVTCLGNDTQRLENTLETIWCYTNGQSPVSLQQVQEVISGNEAADTWVFSNALCKRDLKEALRAIDLLLNREKDPESAVSRLILQAASSFQNFVQAKLLMKKLGAKQAHMVERSLAQLPAEEQKELKKLYPIAAFHPYRLKLLLEDSMRYNNRETLEAVDLLNDTVQKLFQTSSSKRLILESAVQSIISKYSA